MGKEEPSSNDMSLPTEGELNPIPEDLDGQCAVKNFLGKNLAEAEEMFREAALVYQEDLMFMGPAAFRFYVQAAIRYLQRESAIRDSDMINCFASVLEFRLEYEADQLVPVAGVLSSVCGFIVLNYERFDVTPNICGDLRPRYEALQKCFQRLGESDRRV